MMPPSLTIGIEEEYQIIDPETRELRSYITEILEQGRMIFREQVKPEKLSATVTRQKEAQNKGTDQWTWV